MTTILKPEVTESDNIQGDSNAVITLVEYGDYQCPHCGLAYPIIKQIQDFFGDKLKFVFRNFPLQNIHELAVPAAIASEAIGKQNKFWEMHDAIFENQNALNGNSFNLFAEQLGADIAKFDEDRKQSSTLDKVEGDFESGIMSGVNGTPTFFINGVRHNASWEFSELVSAINKIINETEH